MKKKSRMQDILGYEPLQMKTGMVRRGSNKQRKRAPTGERKSKEAENRD